jgi:hypothetical protein
VAGAAALPARCRICTRSTALPALGDTGWFEIASPVASTALVAVLHPSPFTGETLFRRQTVYAASAAGSAHSSVLPSAIARFAQERPLPCSLTLEARAVIVDRADEILPDRRGPVLITLGPRSVVLPKQELYQPHRNFSLRRGVQHQVAGDHTLQSYRQAEWV